MNTLQLVCKLQVGQQGSENAIGRDPQRLAVGKFRTAIQQLAQLVEVIWKQKIVIRGKGNHAAARLAQRHIAIGVTEVWCLGQVEKPDSLVLKP
jgi:hypothetical protein